MNPRTLKYIEAKHRRQQAEFIRRLRISMYVPSELPLQPSELRLLPNSIIPVLGAVFLIVVLLVSGCNEAFADIPEDKAVKAIIGEAENQGYDGMKAVACVMRTRGSLKGIYGYNAPRVKAHKYSEDTEAKAIVAWETSADPLECRYMQGSTHWENVKAFGEPYWADSMTKTVLIKDHQFYREK